MAKWHEYVVKFARFGRLEILAYCHMSSHTHLLIRVPDGEEFMKNFTEEDLWEHLEILYTEEEILEVKKQVAKLRDLGANEAAEAILDRYRDRMFNLSAFWQQLKRQFSRWYNYVTGRKGTLFEERYRCLMVEPTTEALSMVGAYIDLNPVRAGMVEDPVDYAWCSYGAAVGGSEWAQEGLMKTHDQEKRKWEDFMTHYRMYLYGEGVEVLKEDGTVKRKGFEEGAVDEVREAGGKLSLATMLRSRNRHLTRGEVIGRGNYIKEMVEAHRSYFGQRKSARGYALEGGEKAWKGVRSLRNPRVV